MAPDNSMSRFYVWQPQRYSCDGTVTVANRKVLLVLLKIYLINQARICESMRKANAFQSRTKTRTCEQKRKPLYKCHTSAHPP